jgi:outer membrane cobalamin receptor
VIDLPTGTVSIAVGAQRREQSLSYVPDALAAQGKADAPTTDSAFSGKQHVNGGYVEALLPIKEIAQLQFAVRHEDYGGSVGSTTDPKVAARLNLFSGLLGLRGSWGTSFQAPTLTQGATSQAFQVINDPVVLGPNGLTCGTGTTGNNVNVVTSGGNLTPQTSRNFDVGFDLRPIESMAFGANYWHYDYSELIAAGQNGQAIVNGECVNGVFVNDPRAVRGSGGQLFAINTAYVNVGKVVTDGIDLTATWHLPSDHLGDFQFRADATYVNKFDMYNAAGVVQHNVGSRNFNNNFAPMPPWRATARANWTRSIHELSLAVRFTDSYRNDQSNNAPIRSFTTADLQYGLHLSNLFSVGSTDVFLGVNNVLDEEPPALIRYNAAGQLISGTVSDVDRPGYDPLSVACIQGRIFYVRFMQKF